MRQTAPPTAARGEAAARGQKLLGEKSVAELCELAVRRGVDTSGCVSVERDELLRLAGEALDVDPDNLDDRSVAELLETLSDPSLEGPAPSTYYDKDKLIAALVQDKSLAQLRGLLVDELGVDRVGESEENAEDLEGGESSLHDR